MPSGLVTISYLVAAVLFILALGGLSRQETARRGNLYGLTGMGERLRELGGSLVVASHPGRGFEVRATLPTPEGTG